MELSASSGEDRNVDQNVDLTHRLVEAQEFRHILVYAAPLEEREDGRVVPPAEASRWGIYSGSSKIAIGCSQRVKMASDAGWIRQITNGKQEHHIHHKRVKVRMEMRPPSLRPHLARYAPKRAQKPFKPRL